ncbi:MAG: hypothetical protein J0I11_02535 [Actinobacteria bacterium]|mgnify:FL=1|nr:hypothetical protein [Actinomycetota bacterium]
MKPRTSSWASSQAERAEPQARAGAAARAAAGAVILVLATLTGCGAARSGGTAPTTPAPQHITLQTAKAPFGTYLTDGSGRALYMWDADRTGAPTCYGDCAATWPPVTVSGDATAGPGVQGSLISQVKRTDGVEQVTYGGWPLYYYQPDARPGELSGQGNTGFGAVWWVVGPDGKPLPSEPQG